MIEIEKPRIETEELSEDGSYGRFVVEPLERGYGTTLGNSLRRVLLSSLPGVAATSVKFDGVVHEFSTIDGVKEDVTDIVLNVKGITAKLFCDETGVDALAVAIGNAHGNYPVLPNLRFDVLDDINKIVETPLVLHGGTGITDEMFQQAIMLGVRKVNIATASFDNLAKFALEYCKPLEKANYFELSKVESMGVYENVKRHIKVFSFMNN